MRERNSKRLWVGTLIFASLFWICAAAVAAEGKDPTKETVLIGVKKSGGLIIRLEIEPAQAMFMMMQGMWMEMKPEAGEIHHFEVKPEDPASKTRLSYALVKFRAVNQNSSKIVEKELHPMWGGSGLHYGANGVLPGDGPYVATVTVEPPTFARGAKNKDMWRKPSHAEFKFAVRKGLIVP